MAHPVAKQPKKTKVNRRNKVKMVFDESARKEFLTGFRKRKDERRRKAKIQIEAQLKEEMKLAKEQAVKRVLLFYLYALFLFNRTSRKEI